MIEVLTALPGVGWEGDVVARLEHAAGVRVVRRCVDLPDLLAVAAAGVGDAVLLSAELRRLDRDALARLAAARVAVVGLSAPDDFSAEQRLRALGVRVLVAADASADELADALTSATGDPVSQRAFSEPLAVLPQPPTTADADLPVAKGALVAVWGPTGAPGRTTVAVTLAAEAARCGAPALLVDADSYGGVVAQCVGLLDEAPGLAAAARAAAGGALDLPGLSRLAPQVQPGLRVLTGIPRADRWPELRTSALEEVYRHARGLADLVVVDCGFCLEQDEELSFDVAAPRRNGATVTTLEQADTVVAVCAADPIGMQRFVRALADLRELVPGTDLRVVVNRVRRSATGPKPERQLAEALERYAGLTDCVFVPEDRDGVDDALLAGRTLDEASPASPVRVPLARLAADLTGMTPPRRGRLRRAG